MSFHVCVSNAESFCFLVTSKVAQRSLDKSHKNTDNSKPKKKTIDCSQILPPKETHEMLLYIYAASRKEDMI